MAADRRKSRAKGLIRRRGNSFQVLVYAGLDPLTGRRMYLSESTTDEKEAQRIQRRLLADVDAQRNAKTRATLGATFDAWLRVHEAEPTTLDGYRGYIERCLKPALGDVSLAKVTPRLLEELYAELRRCRYRCYGGEPAVDHRTTRPHECRVVRHRRPPGRPREAAMHDCDEAGCTIVECPPHRCTPMAPATVRQIHFITRAALAAAIRWGWITSNPADVARKPRPTAPQPKAPTAAEVARIVAAAWEQEQSWGTLVWLVIVTGMRRGEVLALRWAHVDFEAGMLDVRRSYVRSGGRSTDKDTKTHQMRRVALDTETVAVLAEHRQRYEALCGELGVKSTDQAFLFSHEPTRDRPYDPSAVTHRYAAMCAELGIDSHIHALRHYSATELLTAGVDLRTVAGRLGHGGVRNYNAAGIRGLGRRIRPPRSQYSR